MTRYSTIYKRLLFFFAALFFSFSAKAQGCVSIELGLPFSNIQTVTFKNALGLIITDCPCQFSSGKFTCNVLCLPVLYTSYSYVSGGVTITCPSNAVLPVELKKFDAVVYNGDVQLVWSTETERDNAEFMVERSGNGVEFVALSRIPGAMNSSVPLDYSFSDTDPLPGISYYRLSQRDINGAFKVIGIVSVEMSTSLSGTIVAPNPANGRTKLLLPLHTEGQEFDVTICNDMGRVIRRFTAAEDQDLELPTGVYRIAMISGMQAWSEKLVMID